MSLMVFCGRKATLNPCLGPNMSTRHPRTIKLHIIIIIRVSHRACSGAVGVDYIIISYGHLFRVSHTAQELWESTTSSSATVTYSESHTELRICGSRGGRPGVPVPHVFCLFFCFLFFVDVKQHWTNESVSHTIKCNTWVCSDGGEQRYSWLKQSLFAFMKIRTIKIIVWALNAIVNAILMRLGLISRWGPWQIFKKKKKKKKKKMKPYARIRFFFFFFF